MSELKPGYLACLWQTASLRHMSMSNLSPVGGHVVATSIQAISPVRLTYLPIKRALARRNKLYKLEICEE